MFGIGTAKARLHVDAFVNMLGEDEQNWGLSHKGLVWHKGQHRYTLYHQSKYQLCFLYNVNWDFLLNANSGCALSIWVICTRSGGRMQKMPETHIEHKLKINMLKPPRNISKAYFKKET